MKYLKKKRNVLDSSQSNIHEKRNKNNSNLPTCSDKASKSHNLRIHGHGSIKEKTLKMKLKNEMKFEIQSWNTKLKYKVEIQSNSPWSSVGYKCPPLVQHAPVTVIVSTDSFFDAFTKCNAVPKSLNNEANKRPSFVVGLLSGCRT